MLKQRREELSSALKPSPRDKFAALPPLRPLLSASFLWHFSPTMSSANTISGDAGTLSAEIVNLHNSLRARHGVSNLVWSNTLASFANGVSSSCQFKHSGGPYGENLAYGYGSATAAVNAWYNEYSSYNYNNPGYVRRPACGLHGVVNRAAVASHRPLYAGGLEGHESDWLRDGQLPRHGQLFDLRVSAAGELREPGSVCQECASTS